MNLVRAKDLVKTYQTGDVEVRVVRDVDFTQYGRHSIMLLQQGSDQATIWLSLPLPHIFIGLNEALPNSNSG